MRIAGQFDIAVAFVFLPPVCIESCRVTHNFSTVLNYVIFPAKRTRNPNNINKWIRRKGVVNSKCLHLSQFTKRVVSIFETIASAEMPAPVSVDTASGTTAVVVGLPDVVQSTPVVSPRPSIVHAVSSALEVIVKFRFKHVKFQYLAIFFGMYSKSTCGFFSYTLLYKFYTGGMGCVFK